MTRDEAIALSLVPGLSRVGLTERLRLDDPCLLEDARRLLDQSRGVRRSVSSAGIDAVAWNDPRCPSALLAISDAPPALWYRGTFDALGTPAIAIVGSRTASPAALETAAQLGFEVAARGIAIVSGLARGVDSAAHRGALRSGRTIAVLGSGPDCIYPREHAKLAEQIAQNGLIVSEYPPGTPPLAFHFPMRNRLISGLSRAVVVVEANEKSGSLITAACALEQGRDVMAVPGSVLSGRNRGAHALIRDGAKIVESADDIVEEIGWIFPAPSAGSRETSDDRPAVSKDPLLVGMQVGHAYDLDELATATGVSGVRLLPRLLELELHGNVQRVEGGRFMRRIRTC
jgi:DNA processing protein